MTNRSTGALKISLAAAAVIDASGGIVEYSWDGDDTDTIGAYDTEWQVTFAGALPLTAPGCDFDEVLVCERLPA
jgi:hypothetical protein